MGSANSLSSLRKAADLVGVSPETVRKWCVKYGIGVRSGHRWVISKQKLLRVKREHVKAHEFIERRRA